MISFTSRSIAPPLVSVIHGLCLVMGSLGLAGCSTSTADNGAQTGKPSIASANQAGAKPAGAQAESAPLPSGVVRTTLKDLTPMQAVVGYDQIYSRLGKFERDPEEGFDDYCESMGADGATGVTTASRLDNPASFACTAGPGSDLDDMKTAVRGPGGRLYLTDGHHTFTTFWEWRRGGPQTPVYVRVLGDYSSLSTGDFWQKMQAERRVWLQDGSGRTISPAQLPQGLGLKNLKNDFYRGLVYFTREIGYDKPAGNNEFLEFYWGQWLKKQAGLQQAGIKPPANATEYAVLIERAAKLMVELLASTVIGADKTAAQLGQMPALDTEELSKLTRTGKKPGKLTDLFAYRAGLSP